MSNVTFPGGTSPVSSDALVNVDGVTIFGNGADVPLTTDGGAAGGGSRSVQTATFANPGPAHAVGNVVRQSSGANNEINLAFANATATAFPLGVLSKNNGDGTWQYVAQGSIVLTDEEWVAVNDQASGLSRGAIYYLSATNDGNVTAIPPSGDNYVVQIGVAVSDTELLVNTPAPIAPSASVATPTNTPVVGMALRVSSSGHLAPLLADGSVAPSCSGLMKSSNTDGTINYHNDGPLVLTTGQWDAVVTGESGGLTPGSAYYVSAAAAGKLTVTPPVATGSYIVAVGVALSATTLIVHIGTPVGPHS